MNHENLTINRPFFSLTISPLTFAGADDGTGGTPATNQSNTSAQHKIDFCQNVIQAHIGSTDGADDGSGGSTDGADDGTGDSTLQLTMAECLFN